MNKKPEYDEDTAAMIDELVDIYSCMDQAVVRRDEQGDRYLFIKCVGDKAYRISIEPAGKLNSVPWSH